MNKELTIKQFLCHCGSEDFLWGIVKLMSSENLRVSGNSAYVFGTIAESSEGIERIVGLLNNKKNPESNHILLYLVNLLKSTDYECLMNAAGTIGTIVRAQFDFFENVKTISFNFQTRNLSRKVSKDEVGSLNNHYSTKY